MEKKPENVHPDQWLKDIPLTQNASAFAAEQMIACPKCERPNAPNRAKCIYCGEILPIPAEMEGRAAPNLRKLEIFEKGFNVILMKAPAELGERGLREIAQTLKLEIEILKNIFEAATKLPLARCESLNEAESLRGILSRYGLETAAISDEELHAETPPRRLRGIEILENGFLFRLFNQDEAFEILFEDLDLIVKGGIFQRKIESSERYKKKDENKPLQSTEFSNDEPLIDLYSKTDRTGYRIFPTGFDFSCLGGRKQMTAFANMKLLPEILAEKANNLKIIASYLDSRNALAHIWEAEEIKDQKGLKQEGFGRFNIESETKISNLNQFTKFSRMQARLSGR